MKLTDIFTIIGAISSVLALMMYALVEYPKIFTNIGTINANIIKFTSRFPTTIKRIALLMYLISVFCMTLELAWWQKLKTLSGLEIGTILLLLLQSIYWLIKFKSSQSKA